jgi:hypothetical protein
MKLVVHLKRSDFRKARKRPKHRIAFAGLRIEAIQIKGDIRMFTMTDSQKASLKIQPVDKRGNPTTETGTVTWGSSDPTIVTVTPAADGLSCEIAAAGPLGQCQVTVNDGTAIGILDVTIVAGAEATIAISAGSPIEQ